MAATAAAPVTPQREVVPITASIELTLTARVALLALSVFSLIIVQAPWNLILFIPLFWQSLNVSATAPFNLTINGLDKCIQVSKGRSRGDSENGSGSASDMDEDPLSASLAEAAGSSLRQTLESWHIVRKRDLPPGSYSK